ncbi:MAG: Ig-like domain-containing protein [Oscillospiraceae bacterium]|nr:Ig-like domain-containing protein [Oscillospiraceae bacterium]
MVKICPTCKKFVPEIAQKCPICGNTKLVLANVPASSAAAVAKATVTPKKKKSKAPVIISLLVILAIVGAVSAGVVYFLKSGITINSDSISLKVGETSQLDIATDYSPVTYESADTAIATVNGNGTVTAINVGSTTITATNAKGRTAKCSIEVSHVQPSAIKFSNAELIVAPTQTVSLEAIFTPENTSDRALTYSIDQTSIATVDNAGTVTGVSEGTATLTAKSANGVTATCAIIVLPYADSISIEPIGKGNPLTTRHNSMLNQINH